MLHNYDILDNSSERSDDSSSDEMGESYDEMGESYDETDSDDEIDTDDLDESMDIITNDIYYYTFTIHKNNIDYNRDLLSNKLDYIINNLIYINIVVRNISLVGTYNINITGFISYYNNEIITIYDPYESCYTYKIIKLNSIYYTHNNLNYYEDASNILKKRLLYHRDIIKNDNNGYFNLLPNEIIEHIFGYTYMQIKPPNIEKYNSLKEAICDLKKKNTTISIKISNNILTHIQNHIQHTNPTSLSYLSEFNSLDIILLDYSLHDTFLNVKKFTEMDLECPMIYIDLNIPYDEITQIDIEYEFNSIINNKLLLNYDTDELNINNNLIEYSIKNKKKNFIQKIKKIPIKSIISVSYKGVDDIYAYDIIGIFIGIYDNYIIYYDTRLLLEMNDDAYDLVNISTIKNIDVFSQEKLIENNILFNNFEIIPIPKFYCVLNKFARIEYNALDDLNDIINMDCIVLSETKSTYDVRLESFSHHSEYFKPTIITIFKDKIMNICISNLSYDLYRVNLTKKIYSKEIFKNAIKGYKANEAYWVKRNNEIPQNKWDNNYVHDLEISFDFLTHNHKFKKKNIAISLSYNHTENIIGRCNNNGDIIWK